MHNLFAIIGRIRFIFMNWDRNGTIWRRRFDDGYLTPAFCRRALLALSDFAKAVLALICLFTITHT